MFVLLILLQVATDPTAAPVVVQQAISWTTVMLGLVSGLPATIAAIGGILALLQSRHNAVVAAQTDKKVEAVSEKATEIHTLTNGQLSRVTEELRAANTRIEGFAAAQLENNKTVERMQQTLDKMATNSTPTTLVAMQAPATDASGKPLPVHDEEAVDKLDEIARHQAKQVSAKPEKGAKK